MDCAGTPAFGLSPADEIVALAAHAGKPFHGFTRLIWIADLAMIVGDAAERGTPIDWSGVRTVAEEARCLTVVGAALEMARRAGVEVPRELFPLPVHGWRGRALRQLLSMTWPLTMHEPRRYQLTYALTDAPAQRLRSLLLHVRKWHGLQMRVQNMGQLLRPPVGARRQNGVAAIFTLAASDGRKPEPVFENQ